MYKKVLYRILNEIASNLKNKQGLHGLPHSPKF